MKKYLFLIIAGAIVGALVAFWILYSEFHGVSEEFTPYRPIQ